MYNRITIEQGNKRLYFGLYGKWTEDPHKVRKFKNYLKADKYISQLDSEYRKKAFVEEIMED